MATEKLESQNEVPTSPLSSSIQKAAKVMNISEEDIRSHLSMLGIEDDEIGLTILRSSTTTEDDAKHVFVHGVGYKTLKKVKLVKISAFKAGWNILKGNESLLKNDFELKVNNMRDVQELTKPPSQWPDKLLIEMYGENCDSTIFDELQKRSRGKRFIVFSCIDSLKSDNDCISNFKVDVESTLKLLRLARGSNEMPSSYMVEGKLVNIFRVGEFPIYMLEECPIHKNTILLDGYCDLCKNTWKGINGKIRVIIRIAVSNFNTQWSDPISISRLIDDIVKFQKQDINCIEFQNKQYDIEIEFLKHLNTPAILYKYEELRDSSQLPILKRKIASRNNASDPFFCHRII